MKRLLSMVMALILLVGCSTVDKAKNEDSDSYITGVWISYSEIDGMLKSDFQQEFVTAVQKCKARGITDMFVHVRPFCDAYYKSGYFPMRTTADGCDFDILEYMISQCHKNDIKFHAWINPYRVKTSDTDISTLSDDSPVKTILDERDILIYDGIYLNPASTKVIELITNGVREVVDNYNVDGIHFDDYFYPTVAADLDSESYLDYSNKTKKPIELADWRRANVNSLISSVYTAVKFKNKDTVFSVSPAASIDENYNTHYADVSLWMKSDCVDYIIPQIYFGFEYPVEKYRFDALAREWQKITENTDVKLIVGLAAYKINTQNEPDKAEWSDGIRVIEKQIEICQQQENIQGHVFFSYSFLSEFL